MAVAVFPLPSFTVQVTVVVPIGKVVGALLVMDTTEQLSVVTGVPNTTPVAVQFEVVFVLIVGGAVIVGFSVSVSVVIVKLLVMVDESASIIVQE